MQKHLHLKGLVALAAAIATSWGAYAATPISDAAGLAAIGNDLEGDYELTADITLTGEWYPIGNADAPFAGTFDGKGHTISGLTYTQNGNWVGLFGASTGTIKNVRIVDADIYGNEHVGIAVGRVFGGGLVDNVYTSGYICGRDHTGGIAGDAGETDQTATVSNCLSAAYVLSREYQAGGIVGWSKGTVAINNNLFLGEASCRAYGATAGIVGFVEDGTTTVTGNVCAARQLSGMFGGRNTYGIVGNTYNENSILVSSNNLTSADTKIINLYYDPTWTPKEGEDEPYTKPSVQYLDPTTAPVDYNGTVTSVADLKKAATYTAIGFGSAWTLADGNYALLAGVTLPLEADVIHINTLAEKIYVDTSFDLAPVSSFGREVAIATSDATVVAVDGTKLNFVKVGTATVTLTTTGDTFCKGATRTLEISVLDFDATIATAADIVKFSQNPTADFKLTADIDLSGVEFTPIAFNGSLDGQGHYIRNAKFVNADRDRTAFFTTFGGTFIKNVGFEGCYFVGNADVAAVVGETTSDCVISNVVVNNCYIEGRDHVGSILGKLEKNAVVENCIGNAVIKTRSYQAGGIVGCGLNGTINKCIFSGTVAANGTTNLSAIISLLDADNVTIKNCLGAAASYTNAANAGGTIVNKYSRNPVLENNYVTNYSIWNGVAIQGGEADSESGALITMEQSRSKAWYTETLGLDFTNDWKFLDGGEGNMLPVLKWMNAPLTTVIFNMPSEDGVNVVYFEGTENYSYAGLIGSWGQSVTVKQLNGEDYASIEASESKIYVGDANGELTKGAGTAEFEVGFDAAVANLFTISGRNTFEINVSINGAETTITTVEQFLNIRKNPSGKYVLGADINLKGVDFNGFCNDGSTAFTGTIDGAGHCVRNFNLEFTSGSDHGLFGKTSGATFKNIAFTEFVISAGSCNHIGLIGQGSAYMENVAVVGKTIGSDHVGLVAGDADGIEMLNCYATGEVLGGSQVGGFFGVTLEGGCSLENCLSNVKCVATFRGWTAGFIGLIDKANSAVTIKNCVSIGDCSTTGTGSPHVTAPFIGGNNAGDEPNAVITFTGNIYNSTAVMDADTEWPAKNETMEGGVVEPATAANPNTLMAQGTYTAIGWDFEGVWMMAEGPNYKYPVLKGVKVTDAQLGVEGVVVGAAEANVTVAAANGEIVVAGLGEVSMISVYTTSGVLVATANVNAPEAAVAVPAAGLYIVAVATDGAVATAKVVVK